MELRGVHELRFRNRDGMRLARHEWVWGFVILIQIARHECCYSLLPRGVWMEGSPIHRVGEVEVRFYRIRILAARPARFMIVPDRCGGQELDAGGNGLLIDAIIELVL